MRKLLKTILLAILVAFGIHVSAQDLPIKFGVKGGLNLSNLGGDAEGANTRVGFNVGVTADYRLTDNMIMLSGLEFTTKGTKADVGDKIILSYLQLPVHVGYKLSISKTTKIIFHAGPYVAYGLSGKFKQKWTENGYEAESEVDLFKKQDGETIFKRFDFGLGFGAGVEVGKIALNLGCDFGISNICNNNKILREETKKDFKMRNQNAYLSVGYKF